MPAIRQRRAQRPARVTITMPVKPVTIDVPGVAVSSHMRTGFSIGAAAAAATTKLPPGYRVTHVTVVARRAALVKETA